MNVINFSDKLCERTQTYLDSYLDGELLIETNHEVVRHLESCADCTALMESRIAVKKTLRSAFDSTPVPHELGAAISGAVRRYELNQAVPLIPAFAHGRWLGLAAAALGAAVLLGIGVASLFYENRIAVVADVTEQARELLRIGLGDHVHCAVESGSGSQTHSVEEMGEALGPRYAELTTLVAHQLPGDYRVVGGHICTVNGREFVHLIVRDDTQFASIMFTRKNGDTFSAGRFRLLLRELNVPVYQGRFEGYEVVGFETGDFLGFVVGDASSGAAQQLAPKVVPPVYDFLTGA